MRALQKKPLTLPKNSTRRKINALIAMPQTKKYYRIPEVAEMVGVPPTTLRWWEREIPELKPMRTKGGQRRYRAADIEIVRKIITLAKDKGLSLAATGNSLRSLAATKRPLSCGSDEEALKILARLRSHIQDDAAALWMIEAVEKYLGKES